MGVREEIEKLKAPVEREIVLIGKVLFRRLKVGEILALDHLEGLAYNQALVAASVLAEDGQPLFKDAQEVAEMASCVFNDLLRIYRELNPRGMDQAAKKLTVTPTSP
jgi:hypothetical protein